MGLRSRGFGRGRSTCGQRTNQSPSSGRHLSKKHPRSVASSVDVAAVHRVAARRSGEDEGVQVLLVEDDPSIAASLSDSLVAAGFDVRHVGTGAQAMAAEPGDVVLLDLGLPDMDGYDVCRQLRVRSSVPIIVITARGEEFDRVLGLELGADDYVVKPFGFRELVARIRAVTRRLQTTGAASASSTRRPRRALGRRSVAGRPSHPPCHARSRRRFRRGPTDPEGVRAVGVLGRGCGCGADADRHRRTRGDANWFGPTKTVDAHVAGIRRKLGDSRWIAAVRGVGFRLEVPE